MDPAAEYDRLTAAIRASEDWAEEYQNDPETFGRLLKAEAKLQREFTKYLKEMATERSANFVYWYKYNEMLMKIQAADDFQVDVMISDEQIDQEDNIVLKLVFDNVETIVKIGVDAAEITYARNLGTAELTKIVQKTAREKTAFLVGKRVDSDGNIVDNPKAKYRISDTTRQQVRESIRTSLSLGEDQPAAAARMERILYDKNRAELVAQTEAVNGYQGGMYGYAITSGATGKSAQYLGPNTTYDRKGKKYKTAKPDICGTNADAGVIPIKDAYPSGHLHPAFHPRCRCSEKFHYP